MIYRKYWYLNKNKIKNGTILKQRSLLIKSATLLHLSIADSKLSSNFIGILFLALIQCPNLAIHENTRGAFTFFIRK